MGCVESGDQDGGRVVRGGERLQPGHRAGGRDVGLRQAHPGLWVGRKSALSILLCLPGCLLTTGPRRPQEKKLLQRYFDEISQDTGKYCFMVEDTLKGLELGAVEVLIVWEGLETMRCVADDS